MEENKVLETEEVVQENAVNEDSVVEIVTNKGEKVKSFVAETFNKLMAYKNEQPKKFFSLLGVVAAALVVVIVLCSVFLPMIGNIYKTPLNIELKFSNSRKPIAYFEEGIKVANGFAEKELKDIYNILKKSDDFDEDELLELSEEAIEFCIDEYGQNYKFKYEIIEKEKLEREDLRDFKNSMKAVAETIENFVDEIDELDSDDIEEAADELGLTRSDFKKLVRAYEDLADELKSADVSKGYELEINYIIKGSQLDEPLETEGVVKVFCVNGRWVLESVVSSMGVFTTATNFY